MCCSQTVGTVMSSLSRRELLAAAALAAPLAGASNRLPRTMRANHIADLTHVLSPSFPVIPIPGVTFPIRITPIATIPGNGVYANKWEVIEHNGTHVDAPCHFVAGQPGLDQMGIENFIAPLAVIDISKRAGLNFDTALEPDDVLAYEKRHGRIKAGSAVFLNSGWDRKAKDGQSYLNTDASNTHHFPGFSVECVEFLVTQRQTAGVGVDTISIDIGPDKEYRAHKALFKYGKWAVECVNQLDSIPPSGATVVVAAPRVLGASGAPARIIALW